MDKRILRKKTGWVNYFGAVVAVVGTGFLIDWYMGGDNRVIYWLALSPIPVMAVYILSRFKKSR